MVYPCRLLKSPSLLRILVSTLLQTALPGLQRSEVVGPDGKEMLDDIRTRCAARQRLLAWPGCHPALAPCATSPGVVVALLASRPEQCRTAAPKPVCPQRSSGTFLPKDRDPVLKVGQRLQSWLRCPARRSSTRPVLPGMQLCKGPLVVVHPAVGAPQAMASSPASIPLRCHSPQVVEERVAAVSHLPRANHEDLQVLR